MKALNKCTLYNNNTVSRLLVKINQVFLCINPRDTEEQPAMNKNPVLIPLCGAMLFSCCQSYFQPAGVKLPYLQQELLLRGLQELTILYSNGILEHNWAYLTENLGLQQKPKSKVLFLPPSTKQPLQLSLYSKAPTLF